MDFIKLIGIAVVSGISGIIVKTVKPELSFAVMLVGGIILLSSALDMFAYSFSFFNDLVKLTNIDNSIVKILLKIVGIGYLTEFSSELLTDFGSSSLASKVELCGKFTIFMLSIPILTSLLSVLRQFTDLL